MTPTQQDHEPGAITDAAEARDLCQRLAETMTRLQEIMTEETACVRQHGFTRLEELHAEKTRLSKSYMQDFALFRANANSLAELAGEMMPRLRQAHDSLQQATRDNLTAIAAARAVSEGLLQTIADEVQKKRQPVTAYTATGATASSRRHNPAIAVNGKY